MLYDLPLSLFSAFPYICAFGPRLRSASTKRNLGCSRDISFMVCGWLAGLRWPTGSEQKKIEGGAWWMAHAKSTASNASHTRLLAAHRPLVIGRYFGEPIFFFCYRHCSCFSVRFCVLSGPVSYSVVLAIPPLLPLILSSGDPQQPHFPPPVHSGDGPPIPRPYFWRRRPWPQSGRLSPASGSFPPILVSLSLPRFLRRGVARSYL